MAKESNNNTNNLNIPKGWQYLPFGNVFEFIPTLSLSREQLTKDEETSESIYNIHYGDIHATYNANVLDFDKELRIPKIKDVADLKLNTLKEGDLAIADASEDYAGVAACIELVNIKKRTVTGGLHTFIVRDNSGLTVQGFRTYVLKNPIVSIELKKLATGSKVYGISKTNLATLEILLPPTKEQTKISQILSTWDVSIETLQQLIAKKERRKKALMQKLLTGKIRFKEFKGEKWSHKRLKEISKVVTGNTPPTNISEYYNGKYLFVSPIDLGKTKYINSTEKTLTELGFSKTRAVPKGSILFTCIGSTIGKIGVSSISLATNQQINSIVPFEGISNEFMYYQLNFCSNQIRLMAGEQAVPLINKSSFEEVEIYISTSIAEQKKIASVLSAADEEIQTLKTSLAHYKQQKQGLMQVLLTGKKRVKI